MERHIQADNAFIKWMEAMSKNVVHIADAWYAAVKWADSHTKWIPVEEELPTGQPDENGRTPNYLCFCTGGAYRIANFADGVWWDCDEDTDDEDSVEWYVVYDVTHWMPLPKAPRKEAKNE